MTTYPRDDSGQIQVDFVWGNFPLQPDEDRGMATLDPALDNHVIATTGYSNYPSFIPDYSGDEDAELEYVVPDLVRVTRSAADDLLSNHNTDLNLFAVGHKLTVNKVTSTGKTVRVFAYDVDSWNDGQGGLNGLRVGDELYFTDLLLDGDPAPDFGTVKVTKVNDQGEDAATYFEFKVTEAIDPALDIVASGYVWAGPNLVNVITLQRFWNPAGSIKNPGTNIHVRYFSLD
jgi:hypothetical protein